MVGGPICLEHKPSQISAQGAPTVGRLLRRGFPRAVLWTSHARQLRLSSLKSEANLRSGPFKMPKA